MIIEYVKKAVLCIALVLVQVLILNKLHILGYATPFLYIYFLLKMPSTLSHNALLCTGFALGLAIDIFSDTPGMHTAATTFLALVLSRIISLYVPKGDMDQFVPGIYSVGFTFFVKYAFTAILLHHTTLFLIESFSFWDLPTLLLRIFWSTILTFCGILALDAVNK